MRFVAILAFALVVPSCLPFAIPPSRIEMGSVPADARGRMLPGEGGTVQDSPASTSPATDGPAVLRIGIHPLQVVPRLAGRRIDVGAGYMAENGGQGDSAWSREGPYAEVGLYPFQAFLGGDYRLRAGAVALGEYYLRDDRGYREGLGVSAAVELFGFTSGGFQSPNAVGATYGEWAFGAFAGPGVRLGEQGEKWAGTFGISARIPLTVGVICCIDPTEPHGGSSPTRSKSSRRYHRAQVNRR